MYSYSNLLQQFQSSLPHGSDASCIQRIAHWRISILAPSRERLAFWRETAACKAISILAPSRERLMCLRYSRAPLKFQSSLPHGSDLICQLKSRLVLQISILAPSRERLVLMIIKRCNYLISILAPSRERPSSFLSADGKALFQSSLPHGSDAKSLASCKPEP